MIGLALLAGGTDRAEGSVAIPVKVRGGQGTLTGARPMVRVQVGHSKPVPVLLDTGSTGLRIYAPAVDTAPGSGVAVTSERNSITYAGGQRLTGVVATARLRIGRQRTETRVPFSLVTRASCAPEKPACPTTGGIAAEIASGAYGVLGVGTARGGSVTNPFLAMRRRLARSWSLHLMGLAGTIVLGARVPIGRRVVARLPFAPRVCLTVGLVRAALPGLFDSGTFQFQVWGNPLNTAPTQPGTTRVVSGTPVTVSLRGRPRRSGPSRPATRSRRTP